MASRAQWHRRRSHLARAWDLHIPAICDKRPANAECAGVRTEIAASWERSAAHILPEVHEAPLADAEETRVAFHASPLSGLDVHCDVTDVLRRLRAGDVAGATDRYGGELLGGSESPALAEFGTFVTVALRNALLSDPQPAAVQRYLELAPHDLDLLARTPRPATYQRPTSPVLRLAPLIEEGRNGPHRRLGKHPLIPAAASCPGPSQPPPSVSGAAGIRATRTASPGQ